MRLTRVAIFLLGVVSPAVGLAGTLAEPTDGEDSVAQQLGLSGSLRGGYWSSSRNLEDGEHFPLAALWLKAAPKVFTNASLVLEGWIRNQDLFREDATEGALREAYFATSLGPLDLRVGRQIIAWGRADRINPTDNLTPRDFTLLVPEDEDQRLGPVAVKATYHLGGLALTGVWLPHFEPHTIPLRRVPGVTIGERVPRETFAQWAIRLEQTGRAIDWSLSYFNGFDLVPDFAIDRVTFSSLDVLLKYHRIRVIGADAAATLGRYGVRAEAAYTFTEDPSGRRPQVKNPFFFLVLGGDRTFLERLNVNLQYLFRFVVHHLSPVDLQDPIQRGVATEEAIVANELDEFLHGASLRVSHTWLNETLEGEVAGILTFTRLDFVIRPKLTYAVTDRWKAVVGADIFRGERRSFFGRLRDNSTAFAEVRWSF
ncbi:MAG: hypothetical protein HY725_17305 [Candidatus Rokubacteria bacterium]|nr:hypothetical protein [Candidatus Rokubacteria bacterium]